MENLIKLCFRIRPQLIDHLMAGMEDIVGKTGNYNVRDKFKRFDQKFIRPLILKHIQVNEWIRLIKTNIR